MSEKEINKLKIKDVRSYVEKYIGGFHTKRLSGLEKLKLEKILKKKNPYLFKAKNIITASDLVKITLDAFLSSQEETMFGDFLEDLAIYINGIVYGGRKSMVEGIDLEFEKDGFINIVSIKSGPNWGNSNQIKKMREDFKRAKKVSGKKNIIAINGCCYGRDNKPNRGDYYKYCGQSFWELISGNNNLYIDIIEPLSENAKEKNDEFYLSYTKIVNRFTLQFIEEFCKKDGSIDWEKLVKFNSSSELPPKKNITKK